MNSYELSRVFCNWAFENPEKIKPIHYAIYYFAIEHCNRLGWKSNFGLPSQMVMEATGVKNWRTYSSGLNDLVDFGFIKMIEISKNQYSSNIVAIVKNTKAPTKALDKALQKHSTKQGQSTVSINKQYNKEQGTINNVDSKESLFDIFWNLYDHKKSRDTAFKKWMKLSIEDMNKCIEVIPKYVKSTPDKDFRKHPSTWLNQKCWNDEITEEKIVDTFDMDNPPSQDNRQEYLEWMEERQRRLLKTF
tara:strand:+ start:704 stop:1444 length:741 start_codon:yes stop_codon:yes gene_type:complete